MGNFDQHGVAIRADWRFLTPNVRQAHIAIVGAGQLDDWLWLVEDGWAQRVTVISRAGTATSSPTLSGQHVAVANDEPDIVVIQADGDLAAGLALASETKDSGQWPVVIIERPRSAKALRHRLRAQLEQVGFDVVVPYLVTPNLHDPKRFTPLGRSDGLRWLLARPPALKPNASRLSPRGQLNNLSERSAKAGFGIAADVAARLLRSRLGVALADQVLVATNSAMTPATVERPLADRYDQSVVLTSGHDEGSRAVLIPLGSAAHQSDVIKIAARPAYNQNIDSEVAVIETYRRRLGTHSEAVGYLPQVYETFEVGPLRASRESYGGRSTAADIGYRRPQARAEMLQRVLGTITDFAMAGDRTPQPWSPDLFDRYIAQPLADYRRSVSSTAPLSHWQDLLETRSTAMIGRPIALGWRHYDLGPWNVTFDTDGRLTIIDWEIAPPRDIEDLGPVGADHLYFAKYWLHIAMDANTVEDEPLAFEFLADHGDSSDPRGVASRALAANFGQLGLDPGFVPLLTAHVWLEKALYTMARGGNSNPGSAQVYIDSLATNRNRLFRHWP